MKVQELYTMTFNDACEKLSEQTDLITTYESLKDFAIHSSPADYYDYDYSMGTLETPTALTLTFDLVDYCDDKEDEDDDEL